MRWMVWAVVALTSVAHAEPEPVPYEPPPFTRFPDEPDDLPPLPRHEAPDWRDALRHALHGATLRFSANIEALHGASTAIAVAAALGEMLPEEAGGDISLAIDTRLRLIVAELGWEWRVWKHWTLDVSVGAMSLTSSRTIVTTSDARVQPIGDMAAGELDEAFSNYVRVPMLAVAVGYEL